MSHDARLQIEGRCYCVECVGRRAPKDEIVHSLLLTRALLEQGFNLDDCRRVRKAAEAEAGRLADRVWQLGREQGVRDATTREHRATLRMKLLESRPRVDLGHAAAVLACRDEQRGDLYQLPACSGPDARPRWQNSAAGAAVLSILAFVLWMLFTGWVAP